MLLSVAYSSAQSTQKDYEALTQLVGTWGLQTPKGMLYEQWVQLNDSTLKSSNYKLNGTDTIKLETVELAWRRNKIVYMSTVEDQNNRQPVVFTCVEVAGGKYTFENKEHDYPQRIIYNLPINKAMHAWIEGNSRGKFARSDYNFTRTQ